MNDHATAHDRYHAGPDMDDSPITVTLEDGRVLAFVDYEYTRGFGGSRMSPPESDEVSVNEAWWLAADGTKTTCTADELSELHEDGTAYDLILTACAEREGAKYYASMGDDGGDL